MVTIEIVLKGIPGKRVIENATGVTESDRFYYIRVDSEKRIYKFAVRQIVSIIETKN